MIIRCIVYFHKNQITHLSSTFQTDIFSINFTTFDYDDSLLSYLYLQPPFYRRLQFTIMIFTKNYKRVYKFYTLHCPSMEQENLKGLLPKSLFRCTSLQYHTDIHKNLIISSLPTLRKKWIPFLPCVRQVRTNNKSQNLCIL